MGAAVAEVFALKSDFPVGCAADTAYFFHFFLLKNFLPVQR